MLAGQAATITNPTSDVDVAANVAALVIAEQDALIGKPINDITEGRHLGPAYKPFAN